MYRRVSGPEPVPLRFTKHDFHKQHIINSTACSDGPLEYFLRTSTNCVKKVGQRFDTQIPSKKHALSRCQLRRCLFLRTQILLRVDAFLLSESPKVSCSSSRHQPCRASHQGHGPHAPSRKLRQRDTQGHSKHSSKAALSPPPLPS